MASPAEVRRPEAPLEPEPVVLTPSENLAAWRSWLAQGPQGPIEDETEPDFPEDASR